jgi:serine/threonine protein kinase
MSNMAPFTTTITADPSTNATYTLLSTLGKGGNGTVFLAHDQEGKRVAIKQSNHPDRNNLEREHTMLAMLQEEPIAGIPCLLDLTLLDGGRGLVMEYIEGQSASQIQRHSLSTSQVVTVITDFYRILAHIHQRGIAHYYLQDGNLLWTSVHRIVVIDFGAARIPESADPKPFRTDVIDMLYISRNWLFRLIQDSDCPIRQTLLKWTEETLDALYGPLTMPATAITLLQRWQQVVQRIMASHSTSIAVPETIERRW